MKIKDLKSISNLLELETDLNKLCKILFDCGLGSVDLIKYNITDDESKKYTPHEDNWNYFIEYKNFYMFYIKIHFYFSN